MDSCVKKDWHCEVYLRGVFRVYLQITQLYHTLNRFS